MIVLTTVLLFLQISLGRSFVIDPKATGCSFTLSNLDPEPIVVTSNDYQFLYPEPDETAAVVNVNEDIIISCPGGTLSIDSISYGTTITATCVSGSNFITSSKTFDFNDISCSRNPYHTARYTGNSCENNGKEIEVGFILTDDIFAREMTICFDETNYNPLYSSFYLTRSIGHHESGVDRPSFIEDDFYNLDVRVNDMYLRTRQRSTINKLLGLAEDSTEYIQDSSDFYLARGHLSAKADYVYAPQQTATFHYVNACPQWQSFNGYNWNIAEGDVRDYAETNKLDLIVYTGSYGVTTLPHQTTKEDIPLYLYVDDNGNKALPVPELFWKVVYNPSTKEGVALLGINNPYQTDVSKSIICEDISASINWLSWDSKNIKAGYSYACDINDLRSKISYLPEFETNGLLL